MSEITAESLANDWATNPRWKNVRRDYSAEDVMSLRGKVQEEFTLAKRGSEGLIKSRRFLRRPARSP